MAFAHCVAAWSAVDDFPNAHQFLPLFKKLIYFCPNGHIVPIKKRQVHLFGFLIKDTLKDMYMGYHCKPP